MRGRVLWEVCGVLCEVCGGMCCCIYVWYRMFSPVSLYFNPFTLKLAGCGG